MAQYPRPMIVSSMVQRKLYYQDGSSNKEYWVTVAKDTAHNWIVAGSWGRRGRVVQSKLYLESPHRSEAIRRANFLMGGKTKKGYRDAAGRTPQPFSPMDFDALGHTAAQPVVKEAGRSVAQPTARRVVIDEPVAEPIADVMFG